MYEKNKTKLKKFTLIDRKNKINLCVKRIQLELVGALEGLCIHLRENSSVYQMWCKLAQK